MTRPRQSAYAACYQATALIHNSHRATTPTMWAEIAAYGCPELFGGLAVAMLSLVMGGDPGCPRDPGGLGCTGSRTDEDYFLVRDSGLLFFRIRPSFPCSINRAP